MMYHNEILVPMSTLHCFGEPVIQSVPALVKYWPNVFAVIRLSHFSHQRIYFIAQLTVRHVLLYLYI